jgi:hypothetical protein
MEAKNKLLDELHELCSSQKQLNTELSVKLEITDKTSRKCMPSCMRILNTSCIYGQ